MKKAIVITLSILVFALGSAIVFAQIADKPFARMKGSGHRGGFGMRHGGGPMGRLFRHLDLTDAQKDRLRSIRKSAKASTAGIRKSLRENRKRLAQLGTDGIFRQAEVETLAAAQAETIRQMVIEKEKVKAQIFAVLTPQQQAKAGELKAKFAARVKKRMEMRGMRFGRAHNQKDEQ